MGASESAPADAYRSEDEDKGVEAPTKILHPSLRKKQIRRLPGNIEQLRSDLRPTGKLYLPEDEGYEELRTLRTWNLEAMGQPAGIVSAQAAADVMASVRFAAVQGVELPVAAARKSHLCVLDDALVLDVSAMKTVIIKVAEQHAVVEAGVTFRELDRSCAPHGLAVTGSYDPDAGVIGMALHGGHGFLARKYGLLADNVLSAEVVLVTGELVEASAEHNADLFWAIRGGGGNFGVVTRMKFTLHQLPNEATLVCNAMQREPSAWGVWPFTSRLKMLDEYFQLCSDAPDEFIANLDIAGKGVITQVNAWVGDKEEGVDYFLTVKDDGKYPFLAGEPVARNYHLDIQRQFATLPSHFPAPSHAFIKRAFLHSDYPNVAKALERAAASCPNSKSGIRVYHLGGAAAQVPVNATAVAHRHAKHLVEIRGLWDAGEENRDAEEAAPLAHRIAAWVHETYSEILPLAVGALGQLPVPNDMVDPAEESVRRRQSPFGTNIARLRTIKAQRDAANAFRCNENILGENLGGSALYTADMNKWKITPDIPGPLPKRSLET